MGSLVHILQRLPLKHFSQNLRYTRIKVITCGELVTASCPDESHWSGLKIPPVKTSFKLC